MVETRRRGTISQLAQVAERIGGRYILVGVHEDLLTEALDVMVRATPGPEFYLETSGLYSMGALEAAVRYAGPERILFGSGSPIIPAACAITNVRSADVEDSAREAILGGNAERLFPEAAKA
jgi:predicted TIM-barrel fold metal-dependent hydrolase